MSHIATYNSVLGMVNTEVLKKALEVIAQEEGIEVSNSVKDYYGKSHTTWNGTKILGSLITGKLSRGIGVAVDKQGKLTFVGDPFNCSAAFDQMKARIEFSYKKVALILALQQMGYDVQVMQETQKLTTLQGVLQ